MANDPPERATRRHCQSMATPQRRDGTTDAILAFAGSHDSQKKCTAAAARQEAALGLQAFVMGGRAAAT